MPPLGSSKYIDLLNDEALEEFGKKYIALTDPQKTLIRGRIGGRVHYKKVDPSKNQNLLIQTKTEKKLKDFVQDFKKENKRLPSKKEIQRGTASDFKSVNKYLKEGTHYLTTEEMYKIKKSGIDAADLTATQKKWYAKNKDYLFFDKNYNFKKMPDDFMSLSTNDRFKVRKDYKNRAKTGLNSSKGILERNKKTLEDFLQSEINKVKPGENIVTNSQRVDFLKKKQITYFRRQ